MTHDTIVGIDVSKEWLDVAVNGKVERIDNRATPIAALIDRLQRQGLAVVGMEPTGGYERLALGLFREAGFTVLMVDSWRCRQFAKASGTRAKTDPLDARLIAAFLAHHPARPFPQPSQTQIELTAWSREIARAEGAILSLRNRLAHLTIARMRCTLEGEIEAAQRTVEAAEAEIRTLLANDADLARKADLLNTMRGIGRKTIRVILAEMPELGQIDARRAAALAGLAPYPHESGKRKGRSHIEAGRDALRRAAYLAALAAKLHNPWAKAIYQRLRDAGKPFKVALIALARRIITVLNAILRSNTPWNPTHAN